jgi:hypothetical protein
VLRQEILKMEEEKKLQNEKSKKIIIASILLALFVTSCYYYIYKSNKMANALKRKQESMSAPEISKSLNNIAKNILANAPRLASVNQKTEDDSVDKNNEDDFRGKKKIKPTDIDNYMAHAEPTFGKNDPFSYAESGTVPFDGKKGEDSLNMPSPPKVSELDKLPNIPGLPAPPSMPDSPKGKDAENIKNIQDIGKKGFMDKKVVEAVADNNISPVAIKGFMGKKVIIDLNGRTEALSVNEICENIKVTRISPEKLECDFMIQGKKQTLKFNNIVKVENTKQERIIKYIRINNSTSNEKPDNNSDNNDNS